MTHEESWVNAGGTDSNLRTWITIDGREREILVNAFQTSQHDLQEELRKLDATGIDNHLLVQKIHEAPETPAALLEERGR